MRFRLVLSVAASGRVRVTTRLLQALLVRRVVVLLLVFRVVVVVYVDEPENKQ